MPCVPRIYRIAINPRGYGNGPAHSVENFPHRWRNDCTAFFVREFGSLEGVTIKGLVEWDFKDTGENLDILNNPVWKATKMSTMITAFQQHKLIEDFTSMEIKREYDPSGVTPGRRIYWDTAPACKAIREELLKHKP